MITKTEIQELLKSTETYRVERTSSTSDTQDDTQDDTQKTFSHQICWKWI